MKTTIFSISAILMIVTLLSNVPGIWNEAIGDDDHRENMRFKSSYVNPEKNPLYVEECGSCHIAYSPGLLPTSSWDKIMTGLDDHFGDNAELDTDTMTQISDYLRSSTTGTANNQRSRKFTYSTSANTPIRITKLPYFIRKHDEVPQRIVKSEQVGSLSRCGSCHQDAARGMFDEDNVYIEGIGRWDD